jgi:BMFP domain-containing protein YqiC
MKVVMIMSQTSSRFFDEFAKLMTNAAGAAQGVRQEVDTLFMAQAERVLNELDVVSREEFDAFREMAVKARMQNEALEKRIVELEGALAKFMPKSKTVAKKAKAPASKTSKPRVTKKK